MKKINKHDIIIWTESKKTNRTWQTRLSEQEMGRDTEDKRRVNKIPPQKWDMTFGNIWVDMNHLHKLPHVSFLNKQTDVLRPLCLSLQWMEILTSWLSSQTEMTLCVSTSTASRGPFSTWSETLNQVRTKRKSQQQPLREPRHSCTPTD